MNKKILIVGPNSFIAKTFMNELAADTYLTISVRDNGWKSFDFTKIHTIIYFSAIVHHPEIKDNNLYEEINARIPYQMANMAKKCGVARFIYISTVAVFGLGPQFGKINRITRKTPLRPLSLYGQSKLKGEQMLSSIEGLSVQIVRLPNVYGKDCPGTFYHHLEKLATLRWIPTCRQSYRFSLISVENVAKALIKLLKTNHSGIFIPQDTPVIGITDRIRNMALSNGICQKQINMSAPLRVLNRLLPRKYTDNLYGGFYIDTEEFDPLT